MWRGLGRSVATLEQDSQPKPDQHRAADQGKWPSAAGRSTDYNSESKRCDRRVQTVGGGDTKARHEAVEAAAKKGPPKAQKEDWAGRRGDRKPKRESAEQQAGHRGLSSAAL